MSNLACRVYGSSWGATKSVHGEGWQRKERKSRSGMVDGKVPCILTYDLAFKGFFTMNFETGVLGPWYLHFVVVARCGGSILWWMYFVVIAFCCRSNLWWLYFVVDALCGGCIL